MPDPQKPVATTGLAFQGQALRIDTWSAEPNPLPRVTEVTIESEFATYSPYQDTDYQDIQQVNIEILHLLRRLSKLRQELRIAERNALHAKQNYEASKKRTLIGLTGGSAAEREAAADLMHEELANRSLVCQQVAREIMEHSRSCRIELEALREISTNIRRQLDIHN